MSIGAPTSPEMSGNKTEETKRATTTLLLEHGYDPEQHETIKKVIESIVHDPATNQETWTTPAGPQSGKIEEWLEEAIEARKSMDELEKEISFNNPSSQEERVRNAERDAKLNSGGNPMADGNL